jgi:uncharacterized protein YecE (DUF72 family)
VTEGWAREVPEDFRFTLKMSQRVTHVRRLADVTREIGWFCDGAYGLGPKLGAVLVQLPPNFKRDLPRLETFLAAAAPRLPLAVEFRHASWFEDSVYDALRRHAAALAVVEPEEGEELPCVRLATGPFVYVRLRKGDYTGPELADWAAWMSGLASPVYCYLKHEENGPGLARRLLAALAG